MRTTPPQFSNNGFVKERTDETLIDRRLSRSSRPRASRKGAAATRESPFRPRSLPSVQNGEPRPRPAFNAWLSRRRQRNASARSGPRRTPWERKPIPLAASAGPSPAGGEAVKLEDIAVRLAEAYARGREEGLAEGRAEAADRHAAELAAARREAERTARVPAQRIRSARERDPFRIERDRGQCRSGRRPHPHAVSGQAGGEACGGRIVQGHRPAGRGGLARADDDSRPRARARAACANGSPICRSRSPTVDDKSAEVVVEANATQIVTALRSWAELLASLAD